MDFNDYYCRFIEIPVIDRSGFKPPFNNVSFIFENFNFEEWSSGFSYHFGKNKTKEELIKDGYIFYEILGIPAEIDDIERISDNQIRISWKEFDDYGHLHTPEPITISPEGLAREMFKSELYISEKVFKEKSLSLSDEYMKIRYYQEIFTQLDRILGVFYSKRENFKPFEQEFGSFFYKLYDLTYPYLPEDSGLNNLQRVFENIKKQRSEPARNDEFSSIEKIVDMLIAEGDLSRQSRNDLIAYLEDGIYKDATEDSVRWLGTADSFTQFIFALVQVGQYKQPGNIKWRHWNKAIRFPGGRTIERDTPKKSYQKARKNPHTNPYITKVNQAIASSLS